MKKNLVLLTILALSAMVSSCGSIGSLVGSGTLTGVAGDYLIGATGQRKGIIGRTIEDAAGSWSNDGARITVTSATASKGLYNVVYRGVSDFYYLQPANEAMKSLPAGYKMISFHPYWNTFYGELVWIFYTSGPHRKVIVRNNGSIVRFD